MAVSRCLWCVVIAILVEAGEHATSATSTVGVVTCWRYPQFSALNIVLGKEVGQGFVDLGTWSPPCHFRAAPDYTGRVLRYNCSSRREGTELRLELDSPSSADLHATYVCGNGALQPDVLFNCSASYSVEPKNAAARVSSSSVLITWLAGLALCLVTRGI